MQKDERACSSGLLSSPRLKRELFPVICTEHWNSPNNANKKTMLRIFAFKSLHPWVTFVFVPFLKITLICPRYGWKATYQMHCTIPNMDTHPVVVFCWIINGGKLGRISLALSCCWMNHRESEQNNENRSIRSKIFGYIPYYSFSKTPNVPNVFDGWTWNEMFPQL